MSKNTDNNINHPLSLEEATYLINCGIKGKSSSIHLTDHARQRMSERQINIIEIRKVLKRGVAIEARYDEAKNRWGYCINYEDKLGDSYVVTAIPKKDRLVIITVYKNEPEDN